MTSIGVRAPPPQPEGARRQVVTASASTNTDGEMQNPGAPSDPQRMCAVCGIKASGLHFGVFTCESCKLFYLRVTKTKAEDSLICGGPPANPGSSAGGNGDCVINERTRAFCRYCRFKKCLAVGMARHNSRLGRNARLATKRQPSQSQDRLPTHKTSHAMSSTSSKTHATSPTIARYEYTQCSSSEHSPDTAPYPVFVPETPSSLLIGPPPPLFEPITADRIMDYEMQDYKMPYCSVPDSVILGALTGEEQKRFLSWRGIFAEFEETVNPTGIQIHNSLPFDEAVDVNFGRLSAWVKTSCCRNMSFDRVIQRFDESQQLPFLKVMIFASIIPIALPSYHVYLSKLVESHADLGALKNINFFTRSRVYKLKSLNITDVELMIAQTLFPFKVLLAMFEILPQDSEILREDAILDSILEKVLKVTCREFMGEEFNRVLNGVKGQIREWFQFLSHQTFTATSQVNSSPEAS